MSVSDLDNSISKDLKHIDINSSQSDFDKLDEINDEHCYRQIIPNTDKFKIDM